MQKNILTPELDPNLFTRHVQELRNRLANATPSVLSVRSGAEFHPSSSQKGEFSLSVWGQVTRLSFPELIASNSITGQESSLMTQAMILYYFSKADGSPAAGRWVSFADLPDGRFYNQAFMGYTGNVLQRAFGDDLKRFEKAAESSGGSRQDIGDSAFSFQVFPRVPILAVGWQGDEDFPSSYQILFDASVSHYLPTDGCAILGSTLTRRLTSVH